jgi:hypothetical protein
MSTPADQPTLDGRSGLAFRKPVGHSLKTLPEYTDAVGSGAKTFEVRRDDRDFQVGDWLQLREWDAEIAEWGPRWIACKISYVLRGPASELFGVRPGFCVLGIKLPANHQWPPTSGMSESKST